MLEPIGSISPSRAYSLDKCALREVLISNKKRPLLPISPAARLGSVAHAVLEEAAKGFIHDRPTFDNCWDKHLGRIESQMSSSPIESHLVPLIDSARAFEVKKLHTWKLVLTEFIERRQLDKSNTYVGSEVWIQSHDAKVVGRIDLLIAKNGNCEIIDYKTGAIVDESGSIKEEYKLQMKMYAALYHESEGVWPNRLTLVGVDRKRFEVSFESSNCTQLLASFTDNIAKLNERILEGANEADLSSPSAETCRYCLYRPGCSNYWNQRTDSEEWPSDVAGRVVEITISGIGKIRVLLENRGRKYIVRGLSSRHLLANSIPNKLLICNLSRDKTSGQLVENQMTTCFQIE